jgi:hypothetical protein
MSKVKRMGWKISRNKKQGRLQGNVLQINIA